MGVFVNSGLGGQMVMVPESTYGQVPPGLAGGSAQPYEFNSEGLELKKNVLQGKGIQAGRLHGRASRRVVTMYSVTGPVTMDLPSQYLNQLLFQMFGSKGQPLATLAQDGVTGAYSAVHAPGSLKGSSMCVQKGVPSVDGTAPNPFTYTGIKFTDWTIAVATGAIASLALTCDGRNELAGTGTASQPILGDSLNVYPVPSLALFSEAATNTVFHFREATLYTGGTVSSGSAGGSALASPPAVPASGTPVASGYPYLTAVTITGGTMTAVAVNGTVVGAGAGTYAVPANGIVTLTYTVAPTWAWHAGVTTVSGATAAGNVKSAEIKYAFHMATDREFLGSAGFKGEPIENDIRDLGGKFQIEWLNSQAMYQAYANDTATALELDFIGPSIGSGSDFASLKLLIPNVHLDGESPKIGGPQIVEQTVPFTGLDNGTDNVIQATYWTLDSA